MVLDKIYINQFRNYDSLELHFHKGINIIYGENAQGKTNLLESIYVLALTKSHRSFIDNHLIQSGKKNSKIRGVLLKDQLPMQLEIAISNKNKKIKLDHQEIKRVSDYISKMNIIIFYPEDLDLIKGAPGLRRRYLNSEISQLSSNYLNTYSEYNKILKIRNDYLKKLNKGVIIDNSYFDILTQYLVDKAVLIYQERKRFIEQINHHGKEVFFRLSGRKGFQIKYKTSVAFVYDDNDCMKQALLEKLGKMRDTEIKLGMTLVGPHRDDFEFYVDEQNLKLFGSQGQQRMAILALKLSEIDIFKEFKNTTPILLLDDVFSELDDNKKNNLLFYMNQDIQTIITTTDLKNIDSEILKKSQLIHICDGKIVEIQEEELYGK